MTEIVVKIGTWFLDAYDLDPEKYLKYLLYKLPNESTLTDKEALSAYLPWTKQVQASCR